MVQSSKRNLYGRSVRLDALCTLGNGTLCNIEVQRSDNDDHLRRAGYNASVITSKETEIGEKFENIPEIYIIYISEFDFLKECKTIYHIKKIIKETGTLVDDGVHEIFVNASIDDGTKISELMRCMTQKEVNEANIKAVINMLRLKIDENEIKKLYPSEFEEGKRRFLEEN